MVVGLFKPTIVAVDAVRKIRDGLIPKLLHIIWLRSTEGDRDHIFWALVTWLLTESQSGGSTWLNYPGFNTVNNVPSSMHTAPSEAQKLWPCSDMFPCLLSLFWPVGSSRPWSLPHTAWYGERTPKRHADKTSIYEFLRRIRRRFLSLPFEETKKWKTTNYWF